MANMIEELGTLVSQFTIDGTCTEISPLKKGHINDTFVSRWSHKGCQSSYLHQRINHHVFPDVPGLMHNIVKVIDHVNEKIAAGLYPYQTLTLIPTISGQSYILAPTGNFWRTYTLVPNASSRDICPSSEQARVAAELCGTFQRMLDDCNVADFKVVIPNFHNSIFRYTQLAEAKAQDVCKRVSQAQDALEFAASRQARSTASMNTILSAAVPVRVTHNDLKFNNVLFDNRTSQPLALVDLDTCMPGSLLCDFGDLVRNTSVPAAEDEPDISKIAIDLSYFEAITTGYCTGLGQSLTPSEWDLLHYAPQLLTLTIGIRFLCDFLSGDTYFKTDYPEHNLVRARAQFQIVKSMETHEQNMHTIVTAVRETLTP